MSGIKDRVEARVSQGAFLLNVARAVQRDAASNQADFISHLSEVAERFGAFMRRNSLVSRIERSPKDFWASVRGTRIGFVDGGVAKAELPGAGPIGIKAVSYTVRPGDGGPNRERFQVEFSLTDDVYSENAATFDARSNDNDKLRSSARILAEICAIRALIRREADVKMAFLHGPLVNSVAPFAVDDLPCFQEGALATLTGMAHEDRHFISVYRDILSDLTASRRMVAGVVERDGGSSSVVSSIVRDFHDLGDLPGVDATAAESLLDLYGMTDTQIFDVILDQGEYLVPTRIPRQGIRDTRWNENFREVIRSLPDVMVSFVKPSSLSKPFRVETFAGQPIEAFVECCHAMARLLPRYGFPVGLHVVDAAAKVPAWLSRNISDAHKAALLRNAIRSGSPQAMEYALKMIGGNNRDWLFRP